MSTESVRKLTTIAKASLIAAGFSSAVMILAISAQPVVAWISGIITDLLVAGLVAVNRRLRKLGASEVGGVDSIT